MQTIGERLEEARKKKGVSVREAAEATKIRGDYLQKFEGNQFDIGLAEIYTRGFLRGYASYLHMPADRLLNEYANLIKSDGRPRRPSREIYGRMDLTLTGDPADAAGPGPASEPSPAAPAPAPTQSRPAPTQPRYGRPASSLPNLPAIDPATFAKAVKWVALGALGLAIVLGASWILHDISRKAPAVTASAGSSAAAGEGAEAGIGGLNIAGANGTLTIVATDDVQVKVVQRSGSEGSVLFQGSLRKGERRDFPNLPLYLTATALENVQIEYHGRAYAAGSGYNRVALDFTRLP